MHMVRTKTPLDYCLPQCQGTTLYQKRCPVKRGQTHKAKLLSNFEHSPEIKPTMAGTFACSQSHTMWRENNKPL